MIAEKAAYRDFRNIKEETITFSDGVNIICGDNAEGKTNALEGIYIMAGCRSHRAAKDAEMIAFGKESADITLEYEGGGRKNELFMRLAAGKKRICRKNGLTLGKTSEFIGNFRAVLFTPEHLSIIKSGPSERRLFVDSALCQIYPKYTAALQGVSRTLLQRNRILRLVSEEKISAKDADTNIEVWSEELAKFSETVSKMRFDYVGRLSEYVKIFFEEMTDGRESAEIKAEEPKTAAEFLEIMKKDIEKEKILGTTLHGVHKDDISVKLNSLAVRAYGSQGQQRSCALAMKLAEGEISKEICGEYPVFLLDDILSELDEKRKEYIVKGLTGRQVIITACTKEEKIFGRYSDNIKIISCKNGTYTEIG